MSPGGRRFLRSLIAVLSGNATYFALLPYLPPGAYHEPARADWGLLVDFWFCVVFYGLLGFVKRLR
jgi:hypothetical protein